MMPKILLKNRTHTIDSQNQKVQEKTGASCTQQRVLKEIRILQTQQRILEELLSQKRGENKEERRKR